MAPTEDVNICGRCNKRVNSDDKSLYCDGKCGNWFHIQCVNILVKEYEVLCKHNQNIKWFCNDCNKKLLVFLEVGNIGEKLSLMNEVIGSLTKAMKSLEADNIIINSRVDSVVEDVSKIRSVDKMKLSNPSYASKVVGMKASANGEANSETLVSTIKQKKISSVSKESTNVVNEAMFDSLGSSVTVNEVKKPSEQLNIGERTQQKNFPKGKGKLYDRINKQIVLGTSKKNLKSNLSAVERTSWIFVSRLAPTVTCSDITGHLKVELGGDIMCEELQTKYPGYKSFKIGVPVSKSDIVYNPELWPEGVLVTKFFFSKNQRSDKDVKENNKSIEDKNNSSYFLEEKQDESAVK